MNQIKQSLQIQQMESQKVDLSCLCSSFPVFYMMVQNLF